jgi:hypothetical protein
MIGSYSIRLESVPAALAADPDNYIFTNLEQ